MRDIFLILTFYREYLDMKRLLLGHHLIFVSIGDFFDVLMENLCGQ